MFASLSGLCQGSAIFCPDHSSAAVSLVMIHGSMGGIGFFLFRAFSDAAAPLTLS
jgi:hypothetical protein